MKQLKVEEPKILITGGLGYIGSHTAVVFGQAGYRVIIMDNLSNSHMDVLGSIAELIGYQPAFYDVDLRDYKGVQKVITENHDVQGVIHFAAKKAVGESCQEPFLYYENNIDGTINLLKAMEQESAIRNIVFSSSCTVYDAANLLPPFSEIDRTSTTNPYGTTKLVIEHILKDMSMHKAINAINLRYFNPIGAHPSGLIGENPKGIPSNLLPFIFKVAKDEIEYVKVFGDDYETKDGTGIRDYIHVMDVAEAHLLAFQYIKEFATYKHKNTPTKKEGLYDIFNIGTGEGLSVKEMINLTEKVTERKINYKIVGRRPGDVATTIANPQKAKQILGRTSKRSLYQAVEDGWKFVNK